MVASPGTAIPYGLKTHPIFNRHTHRYPVAPIPCWPTSSPRWGRFGRKGCASSPVTDRARIGALAAGVRVASEARFKTRELHDWLMGSLRWSAEEVARGDGLDLRTLHLPPGGGLLLRSLADWRRMSAFNRIGGYRMPAGIEAGLVGKAPLLVAVVGPQQRSDVLNAGRLMERAWLLLDRAGHRGAPRRPARPAPAAGLGQGIAGVRREDRGRRRRTPETLSLGPDETLHMLLRIGYPEATPVWSLRLPPESVVAAE